MEEPEPAREKSEPRKGGSKAGKGGHSKLQKWEAERRRRRLRSALPLAVLALGAVALVLGAAVLAPPPPSGQKGPCDYPVIAIQHYHAQLRFFDQGNLRDVPGDIGVREDLTFDRSLIACTSGDPAHGAAPVHTHSGEANVLHIESRVDRTYSLADFFRAWGQPIGPEASWTYRADASHRITMEVNGAPSSEWGALVLADGMQIRIDYFQI